MEIISYKIITKGEDLQLLKELSRNGKGRPKEVLSLIREGANPNLTTKNGLSVLVTAIRNRHYDCIPILLKEKADVKKQIPK